MSLMGVASASFQYMLLLRGATAPIRKTAAIFRFNTCSSCEEQLEKAYRLVFITEFQYMLLLRGATRSREKSSRTVTFQYMLLLRGATYQSLRTLRRGVWFNTCSSCEEQLYPTGQISRFQTVSIHAPLARSNSIFLSSLSSSLRFNTCSSCEEQLFISFSLLLIFRFQYMLLLRGATCQSGVA